MLSEQVQKNGDTLLDRCVSSLRRGHANLLCIVPILADDPPKRVQVNWTVRLLNSGIIGVLLLMVQPIL